MIIKCYVLSMRFICGTRRWYKKKNHTNTHSHTGHVCRKSNDVDVYIYMYYVNLNNSARWEYARCAPYKSASTHIHIHLPSFCVPSHPFMNHFKWFEKYTFAHFFVLSCCFLRGSLVWMLFLWVILWKVEPEETFINIVKNTNEWH